MSATTYQVLHPITHPVDVFPQPFTALAFDPISDTLWTGSNSGSIAAYHTSQGIRGVVFPAGGNLAVKDIIATDTNIRAFGVSSDGIGAWNKGGLNKWFYRSTTPITSFSNNSTGSPVFFACTAAQDLLTINSQTGDVVRTNQAISIYTHLVNTHSFLISGSSDGFIRTHDARSPNASINSVKAHVSGLQGIQAGGHFIYTIGMGTRHNRPFPDPLVKVYDARTMRPLPPLPFSSGPSYIRQLPNRPSTVVIASGEGLVNVVDVSNPSNSEFYQIATPSYVTSLAVSPTGSYIALGDADGVIHLLSAAADGPSVPLNGFEGQPIEMAAPPEPLPNIHWTDSTPLNVIGLPYYNTNLLSSFTPKFFPSNSLYYPPPARIPQQILNTMKYNDTMAYANMPKELQGRRNVVPTEPKKTGARFRSGKPRWGETEPDTPNEFDSDEIPKKYRKVEIEYSKFGVEDFDFAFYNNTYYSGLETHIMNSYTNALVQVLHFTRPIRQLAKSHITTDCPREHCLLCELGFVVRMLEDAKGTNCQSSNFCKTLGVLSHRYNLIELVDYGRETADLNYAHMIQSFHRFLMDCVIQEGSVFPDNPWIIPRPLDPSDPDSTSPPAPSPITQLLGMDAKNIIVCTNCKAMREKENPTHIIDMVYPRKPPSNDPADGTDFPSILRNSILRCTTHKSNCQFCSKTYSIFESKRSFASKDLPPILAVNASVFNEESMKYWIDGKRQTFLQSHIELRGQVDGVDEEETVQYELKVRITHSGIILLRDSLRRQGLVVQIVTKEKTSHLVAIVKVEDEYKYTDPETMDGWYLFNDFSVREIDEEEALSFPGNWKVPTVLYFERVDTRSQLDFSGLPNQLDPSILSQDTNISLNRDLNLVKHACLQGDELPNPGTLVAIDAEFVSMQQEETEYKSDGTKKVLRPARLSLARVSVLRGDGPKEGVPFIDDHIHTSELIVDYLTEFSGIKYGDLDPHMSPYTLTPLKVVYKKLRLLVDRGCIFIGHGLSKDFRIINIFVPPEQVLDTVDLYFLKARQRRLSLRFLAWYILKEDIQIETHDSIEDALSALRLYKAYHEFEDQGIFDQKLEEIYKEGKQYNFKPPQAPGTSTPGPASGTATPQFTMQQHGGLVHPMFGPIGQFGLPPTMQHTYFTPSPNPYAQQQHQNWRNR